MRLGAHLLCHDEQWLLAILFDFACELDRLQRSALTLSVKLGAQIREGSILSDAAHRTCQLAQVSDGREEEATRMHGPSHHSCEMCARPDAVSCWGTFSVTALPSR